MVVSDVLVDPYTCETITMSFLVVITFLSLHICHVHPRAWTLLGLPVQFEGMDTQTFKVVQFSPLGVQYFNPKCLPATRIHVE